MRSSREFDRRHGIFWGMVLMGLGVVFLLVQQDVLPRELLRQWWSWWPAILIAWALVRLARPRDASDFGGGVTLFFIGFWLFANLYEWWGLTWHTSWPIALVAVGAGMIARAVAASVMPDRADLPPADPREKEIRRVD